MNPKLILGLAGGAAVLAGGAATAIAYRNGKPIGSIELDSVDGIVMEKATAAAFRAMQAAAADDDVTLKPTSGFRSMQEQQQLYEQHVAGTRDTPVAHPGYSNHQNGIAVDIHVGGNSPTSDEYLWLRDNASRFGFSNTGATFHPAEWWHWERVS